MIRVVILYFDVCPHTKPAADRVSNVAARLGCEIELQRTCVTSIEEAVRLRFLGSPTVRVNGVDIDPQAANRTDFGICCRMYGSEGIPPEAMIAAALNHHA
jgi:hypothetical protein